MESKPSRTSTSISKRKSNLTIVKKFYILALVALLIAGTVVYKPDLPGIGLSAAVASAKTIAELMNHYRLASLGVPKKVKIVLVPGHEPGLGGTEYRTIRERDLVVGIADHLTHLLQAQPQYNVIQTRDGLDWNPIFKNYFATQWDAISAWRQQNAQDFALLKQSGAITVVPSLMTHNTAPNNVALHLHGINKWSNENNVDIELHLHINDYPHTHTSRPGKYTGFVIYVPEKQFLNSTTTRMLATSIQKRLAEKFPVSDMPGESAGIAESQDLIAVGEYDSVSAASLLIEYGYIYEPEFTDPARREETLKTMAEQTYLGIQDFFTQKDTQQK